MYIDVLQDSHGRDDHETLDAEGNGVITIESLNGFLRETVSVPVIGHQPITHIAGMRIVDAWDIHNVNGKLNGVIVAQPLKPKGQKPKVKSVPDEASEAGKILVIQGGFAPEYNVSETQSFVVLSGNIVYAIEDEEIFGGHHIRNIGGRLNGVVRIKDSDQVVSEHNVEFRADTIIIPRYRTIPVLDGRLIKEIDRRSIFNCPAAYNRNGQLYGTVGVFETGDAARIMEIKIYSVVAGKLVPCIDETTGPLLSADAYKPPFTREAREDPIKILSRNLADAARLAYFPSQLDILLCEFPEFEPFISRRKKEYAHFTAEAKTSVFQTKRIEDWLRQVQFVIRHQGEKMRLALEREKTGLNYVSMLSRIRQLRALIKDSTADAMRILKDLRRLEELEDEVIALSGPASDGINYNNWIRFLRQIALEYGYQLGA